MVSTRKARQAREAVEKYDVAIRADNEEETGSEDRMEDDDSNDDSMLRAVYREIECGGRFQKKTIS